jgi:hypothetical protein
MACLIDRKRDTSPISSAQVSAVMGPTPGTILRSLILSPATSRCRADQSKLAFAPNDASRLTPSKGRMLSLMSSFVESSSRK